MSGSQLMAFYNTMLEHFGPQNWWPGETTLEIMVGAVLTQNTNWGNVEKAIVNLKAAQCLDIERLYELSQEELAELIRPAGYFNVKAKRLKHLIRWLWEDYGGDLAGLGKMSAGRLREELLAINGIGRETADSMVLYAFDKPTFVVDTYTYRIMVRHGVLGVDSDYEDTKSYFEMHLPQDTALYNEYHALLVCVGKHFCKPKAKCAQCPLSCYEHDLNPY